ncbi:hypothetical protein E2C01_002374 [Portunus trituberculatus]|uniref:Uncharacterized protein n=1 Tax=Portunus trituberculatus TaxID=210409 RepID=A0A5B7CJI8_PORTR|nr:hypothetical protein [Portunus trituberculatus]
MGSNVYETFGLAPVNDRNGVDAIVFQEEDKFGVELLLIPNDPDDPIVAVPPSFPSSMQPSAQSFQHAPVNLIFHYSYIITSSHLMQTARRQYHLHSLCVINEMQTHKKT